MKKNIVLIVIFLSVLINSKIFSQTTERPEINVVYGKKHIYTIETPSGWINDRELAKKYGLVNLFYHKSDSLINQKSYIYAFGIDKDTSDETLDNFIKGDFEKYSTKYPDFKYEKVEIGFTGGIKKGMLYTFSDLTDRFKEEVLYCETDSAFLIFSFSATTEQNYFDYQPVFDSFINSFQYRGNNPKPFLDYMNKQ